MDGESLDNEINESSIVHQVFDRMNGGHIYYPRRKDTFLRHIQENRLRSIAQRHQFNAKDMVPHSMTAFPEKGILIVPNRNGIELMYIEEPKRKPSREPSIKPVSWLVKESSCSSFLGFGKAKIEEICEKVIEVENGGDKRYYFLSTTNGWIGGVAHVKLIPEPRNPSNCNDPEPVFHFARAQAIHRLTRPNRLGESPQSLRCLRRRINLETDRTRSSATNTLASFQFKNCPIWSCDYSPSIKQVAFGGDKFACVNGLEQRRKMMVPLPGNILSVTFSSNGNMLYCGSDNGDVHYIDFRGGFTPCGMFRVLHGVHKTALFGGDEKIVVSTYEHKMVQVDLRVNKAPLYYPKHFNLDLKIPFSFCELNDTLCSAGQDKTIRFWSLKSGHLLGEVNTVNCHQPHAWYSEEWKSYSSSRKVGIERGVAVLAGPSVYLMDL